ncbi:glycosyltransferase family 2 protein [Psychroserpens sp. S379A]|uniref:glycosyltransferase family 2 protein n=1 Tax=Psychroserpens sp. S379A TaxID=3415137 RepID=UPI003C7E8D38
MSSISALMITYNEINNIDAVISELDFADEIIVVDSFSTDGTYEKLSELSQVKVIQNKFEDFASQRNFAIHLANCEWIFFIDADERLTKELKLEILEKTKEKNTINAYKIKRHFMFNNKRMRFSGLQTDCIFRLFKTGTASYKSDRLVHEVLDVQGKHAVLKYPMLHYTFSDYNSYKTKAEHYGLLKAKELLKKGKRPNWYHFVIKPAYKFLTNYIFRLGFLDGKEGYTICALNAYGVFFRYKALKHLLATSPK